VAADKSHIILFCNVVGVGITDGTLEVENVVGSVVGKRVRTIGEVDRAPEGADDGAKVGVGTELGRVDGDRDGRTLGEVIGTDDGNAVGTRNGVADDGIALGE
jgi:hypothetical protein